MRRLLIVLQARTSSHRLPAKALLPIAGVPLALVCAERLARSGRDLILATSLDSTDDALTALSETQGIRVHRGSLENVAERFLNVAADLGDDDILVRATADNPVPDADLVESMLKDFTEAQADYIGPRSYGRELPIGLAVEIFRVGALRRSVVGTIDPDVAEHVTLRLAQNGTLLGAPSFDRKGELQPIRMTIDTLDDYLVAERAFRLEREKTKAPWRNLVRRFMEIRGSVPEANA